MSLLLAILTMMADPDPDALPTTMSLQEEEGPHRPRGLNPVERQESPDPVEGFSVDFVFQLRSIGGSTKVRENASSPARLNLSDDLGFGNAGGGRVTLRWDTSTVRWFLELELFHASGSGSYPSDFDYDEGHFLGGVPTEATWTGFFGRAGVVFRNILPDPVPGGWIAPLVGLEYPRMSLSIRQPGTNNSSGEQYEQFIPYPIVGVAASVPLSETLTLSSRAFGSWIPSMPTPFTEGGRLKMEIATLNVEADITWRLTSLIRLTAGVGYQFWHGTLTSTEDGNDLKINSPYVQVGIEFRW